VHQRWGHSHCGMLANGRMHFAKESPAPVPVHAAVRAIAQAEPHFPRSWLPMRRVGAGLPESTARCLLGQVLGFGTRCATATLTPSAEATIHQRMRGRRIHPLTPLRGRATLIAPKVPRKFPNERGFSCHGSPATVKIIATTPAPTRTWMTLMFSGVVIVIPRALKSTTAGD